jgi:NAD(P)H-hydrate epimerase
MSFIASGTAKCYTNIQVQDLGRRRMMEYLVNSAEMKRCDAYTISQTGTPAYKLMERAAEAIVDELLAGEFEPRRTLIVCGTGNNSGDGFAAARLLKKQNIPVSVLFPWDEQRCTEETRRQIMLAREAGVPLMKATEFFRYPVIVDALFGIGLSRPVTGKYARLIDM